MEMQRPSASAMAACPFGGVHAIQVSRPHWQAVQQCRGSVAQANIPAPWQGCCDEPTVLYQRIISRADGVRPMTYSDQLSRLYQAGHAGVVVTLLFQRAR
jgi:hypothetical protein